MIKKISNIHVIIIYVLILVIILSPTLHGVGQYWDWSFPYFKDEIKNYFWYKSFSWSSVGYGSPLGYNSDYFFRLMVSAVQIFQPEVLRFIWNLTLLFIPAYVSYLLLKKNHKQHLAILLGLIIVINPAIFYKVLAGHFNYLFSFAIFSFLIYYLIRIYKGRFKDVLIVGILFALSGAQIQFFIFSGITTFLYFIIVDSNTYIDKIKKILFICFTVFLLNFYWFSNFLISQNIFEVAQKAKEVSFGNSISLASLDILLLTFSGATQIEKYFHPVTLALTGILFIVAFASWFYNKKQPKAILYTKALFLTFMTFAIYSSYLYQIPVISTFAPMFREVGHLAPLIIFFLLISMQSIHGIYRIFYNALFLVLVLILNGFVFFSALPTFNFSETRQILSAYTNDQNTSEHTLIYPYFKPYSFLNVDSIFTDKGFLKNNAGVDSFSTFSNSRYVSSGVSTDEITNSIQNALHITKKTNFLKIFSIKHIYDMGTVYESQLDKYIPSYTYNNDKTLIKKQENYLKELKGEAIMTAENIYEIKNSNPHIYSSDNLISINASNSVLLLAKLVNSGMFSSENLFTFAQDLSNKVIPQNNVILPLFENSTDRNFKILNNKEFIFYNSYLNTTIKPGTTEFLIKPNLEFDFINDNLLKKIFINTDTQNIEYKYINKELVVRSKYYPNILLNNEMVDSGIDNSTNILTLPIIKGYSYLSIQNELIKYLKPSPEWTYLSRTNMSTDIYKVYPTNKVADHSFESSLWQEKVGDCNNYDDNPSISYQSSNVASDGSKSLELSTIRHTACVNQKNISLDSESTYVLSFDYKSDDADYFGYNLNIGQSTTTVFHEKAAVKKGAWNSFNTIVKNNSVATEAILHLYAYEIDGVTKNSVLYDNVRLFKIIKEETVEFTPKQSFESVKFESVTDTNLKMSDANYPLINQVPNSSLESGLWKDTVSDCNNYDKEGILKVDLSKSSSDGKSSLELSVTKHIACTGPDKIKVTGGSSYIFSFDYFSNSAEEAGFYINFNDLNKLTFTERIAIDKKSYNQWKTYTKLIDVPADATEMSMLVYAYETDGKKSNVVNYDNFNLIEIPDIKSRYYLLKESAVKLIKPKEIAFEVINPTKKLIYVKGASTSFYVAMSESFHPKWQLQHNNNKVNGFFKSWIPWIKPDTISDENHFKLNDMLNGWYVDIDKHCVKSLLCTLNKDGTYDMELVAEFTPQRWFYISLLISGTTLVSCIGFLIFDVTIQRRRRRIQKTLNLKSL